MEKKTGRPNVFSRRGGVDRSPENKYNAILKELIIHQRPGFVKKKRHTRKTG